MQQVEMISLEDLIPQDHNYRKFVKIWSFNYVEKHLKKLEKDNSFKGYGLLRLFKCLLLQFMKNISDRELERYIQENNSAKWFCHFTLSEKLQIIQYFVKYALKLELNYYLKYLQN